MPAKAPVQSIKTLDVPTPSLASQLPQVFAVCTDPLIDTIHCGSGLARESAGSVNEDVGCTNVIAGKPAPTGFAVCTDPLIDTIHCGSGLARESAGSVNEDVGCTNVIAGKPACMLGLEGRRRDKARF
ncbi:hypothetical protein V9L13_04390 [Pseudomonas sp. RSB 5.4]|uniref:hypothetical protein n=1 Tax=Pseudomonas sp. RSB 5.4 TaxID=3127459 RepID=UPI0030CE2E9A